MTLVQETVSWTDAGLIDCFTTFGRSDGFRDSKPDVIANVEFMSEANLIWKYQLAYSSLGPKASAK